MNTVNRWAAGSCPVSGIFTIRHSRYVMSLPHSVCVSFRHIGTTIWSQASALYLCLKPHLSSNFSKHAHVILWCFKVPCQWLRNICCSRRAADVDPIHLLLFQSQEAKHAGKLSEGGMEPRAASDLSTNYGISCLWLLQGETPHLHLWGEISRLRNCLGPFSTFIRWLAGEFLSKVFTGDVSLPKGAV